MKPRAQPLIEALAHPASLDRFSLADWDRVIRQARAAGLLATLHHAAVDAGQTERLPARVRAQLTAAAEVAARHRDVMRWEAEAIGQTLERIGVPVMLLKGAAYLMADLEAARGRLFGDIDILVPRGALAEVEDALGRVGWVQDSRDAYDDRYYRRWMHEIPARRHAQRGTVLDVHHNILPLTARNQPAARDLWDAARRLDAPGELYVPCAEDLLLHSAAHLFLNGEFDRGLRDLNDFRRLARQFAGEPDFMARLATRAERLDLVRPLTYATRYANRLLAAGLEETATMSMPVMDALFTRGLRPDHASARDALTPLALFALYVRGHYLRMPFHLLLPHLLYKATLAKFHDTEIRDENAEKLARFRAFLGK